MNYTFQSFNFRGRAKLRPFYNLIASIAAEEYSHLECGARANKIRVYEMVDDPTATPRRRSTRQVAWLLLRPPNELEAEERAYVERLLEGCPVIQKAATLALAFLSLVCQREPETLEAWLQQATDSGIPELERFAAGLERDGAAVRAALRLPYSNGQLEGQVNRLKLIKLTT